MLVSGLCIRNEARETPVLREVFTFGVDQVVRVVIGGSPTG